MASNIKRPGLRVCRECMTWLNRPTTARLATINRPLWTVRCATTTTRPSRQRKSIHSPISDERARQARPFSSTAGALAASTSPESLQTLHNRIFELSSSAIQQEDGQLPEEQRVLYVLEQLDALAHTLLDAKTIKGAQKMRREQSTTATSALLGSVNTRQNANCLSKASLTNTISEKSEAILRHPNIFITPAILKAYIALQSSLHHPSSFPDIFALYASKPSPKLTKNPAEPIEFTPVSPNEAKAAVDPSIANTALTSALEVQNLPLALSIISSTFCTSAFRKSKLLRQALVPGAALVLAPIAAYALASKFSDFQSTMSPGYATGVAFTGIMTYMATVTGLGYVVVTTTNDQMDRVTWAKGVPLWERWIREEERAALDMVAGRWGFQDVRRRGEEEGVEWEELREWVGVRGMVLDQVELMDGME